MIGYVVKTKGGYLNTQMMLVDELKYALVLGSKKDAELAGSMTDGAEAMEVDVKESSVFRGTYYELH